ncbi:MAG: 16S rRNA (guanine(966)-N(2))-methyltransferase RsmD [Rhodobacteraceae bacterium]|nr:MAG: 16S rRNA (guanine(966)-N(2))-methyltransferase RsmD [Paracoccaceae bacterium]
MRIIGGRFRGRTLSAPGAQGGGAAHLRPTADRVREALFNALAHGGYADPPVPEGMRVLDLFAGSGALGLEALSRGAVHCLFVDDHGPSRALIRRNVEALGVIGETKIYRRDATRLGPCHGRPYDLVFLDPPYGSGLGPKALAAALDGGWLAEGALAALEVSADEPAETPPGFDLADDRSYGGTRVLLMRRT